MSNRSERDKLMKEMKELRKQPRTQVVKKRLMYIEDELRKIEFQDKNIGRFNEVMF